MASDKDKMVSVALDAARCFARGAAPEPDAYTLRELSQYSPGALVGAQLVEAARLADAAERIAVALEKMAGVRHGE